MVVRYDGVGMHYIPPEPDNADYQQYLTWKQELENEAQLMIDAASALEVNRTLGAQNNAIIAAAFNIESFAGTNLAMADIISTLKQLAVGIRIMAEHDQQALIQRNALIRLRVGDLSGID